MGFMQTSCLLFISSSFSLLSVLPTGVILSAILFPIKSLVASTIS